jgi:hypothetical protein
MASTAASKTGNSLDFNRIWRCRVDFMVEIREYRSSKISQQDFTITPVNIP